MIFVLLCCIALSFAVPAPRDIKNDQQQLENIEDLKDGEEEKDLKGAESAYHGWYGGYPYYPYRFVDRIIKRLFINDVQHFMNGP